jgi:hypothetical protein
MGHMRYTCEQYRFGIVTLRPGAQQVAPRWLEPYIVSRVLMARVANDIFNGMKCVMSYHTAILHPVNSRLSTVAMSVSGQHDRCCIVATFPHIL